jgi:hypothetical protein
MASYTFSHSSLADQPIKKCKMNCGQHTFTTSSHFYQIEKMKIEKQESEPRRKEQEEESLVEKKGKQKETRKRKKCAA